MRLRLGLVVLVLAGAAQPTQGVAGGWAGWLGGFPVGTCAQCCAAYPGGWRGMCVRRCTSERRWVPAWQRRQLPCECGLNWRRVWSCGRSI